MVCSILFRSTYTRRLVFAALAYCGFCGFENVECVGMPDATASEVGKPQQPLSSIHPIMAENELDSGCTVLNQDTEVDLHRENGPLELNSSDTADSITVAEDTHSPVSQQDGVVGTLNDQTALEFVMKMINTHLSFGDRTICCMKKWFSIRDEMKTEQQRNSMRYKEILSHDKQEDEKGELSQRHTDKTVIVDEKTGSGGNAEPDNGLNTGVTILLWINEAFRSVKYYIFGDYKDLDTAESSVKKRLGDVGGTVVKKVVRKIVAVVSTAGNILGVNDTLYPRIRNLFVSLFYPPSDQGTHREEQVVSSLDEECFQEKASRLNAFYKFDAANNPYCASRAAFYGPLSPTVDIADVGSPFEVARCSNAAQYLVAQSNYQTILCSYSVFLAFLFI
ncbi:uncharacterized protein BXIN_1144 [Babesia sp. Xinjiang]|uniref:uncharacterized protein n=1 Tax=Babesia sp. Xinjiang TaxID=462227 RepID=UPI000A221B93|nr:uncharacterized protein BXIN_1144 [Babesia sp. Xinjiang]ORM40100.1 hypothetical protein BXIN_1144 [Babesia sp. Xinjiang]